MGLSCCVRGTRRAEWWIGVRTDLCIPPIRAAKGWGTRTVAVPALVFGGMVYVVEDEDVGARVGLRSRPSWSLRAWWKEAALSPVSGVSLAAQWRVKSYRPVRPVWSTTGRG